MPDVQIPQFHEMMWPTLEALKQLGGSGTVQEIVDKVMELQRFTGDQHEVPHGDGPGTEIAYRLAWSRTYLKKGSALENSARGAWSITEMGKGLRSEDTAAMLTQIRAAQRKEPRRASSESVRLEEVSDEVEKAQSWKDQLLDTILRLPPDRLERLTQRLLREAGFINTTVTGRSGDEGIDGVGVYRLSLVSFPVFFQCKRYRGSVGAEAVRNFRGAMAGRGDKGLLITTGSFSAPAKQEATREGATPIDLIDGDRLCDLLKEFSLGVQAVEEVRVNTQFFEAI